MIPEWNPFDAWPAFQRYANIEWLQFAPFVEVGRVAPVWDPGTLHSSMKWSAALGLRAWASGFVVRVDTGFSEEGAQVQMIDQPAISGLLTLAARMMLAGIALIDLAHTAAANGLWQRRLAA